MSNCSNPEMPLRRHIQKKTHKSEIRTGMRSKQIPEQLLLLRRRVFGAFKQRDERHLVRALACMADGAVI